MCGDGDWAGSVSVVIVGCPSEGDAVEAAVDTVILGEVIEELNE